MHTCSCNPYIGHPSQLLRVNDYFCADGFAKGMRATDLNNGPLAVTICADKGMDLPYVSYRGYNLGYITPSGLVAPAFYDDRGDGFLRGFFAGFLTTCGLTHMGAPCSEGGREYGMHGRINNTPAEQYGVSLDQGPDGMRAAASGLMRQGVLFGEHLTLRRQLILDSGKRSFSFTDTVSNHGFARQQHMILYHFNLGYPLLSEDAELILPSASAQPRDAQAQAGLAERLKITPPSPGYQEQCFFCRMRKDTAGRSFAGLYNHRLGFGVLIHYDAELLDHFTQWKLLGAGEYALGLEPGNATPLGVAAERALGHVKVLEPQQQRVYRFRIDIIEGSGELSAAKEAASRLS